MSSFFDRWLNGDIDVMEDILDTAEVPDSSREDMKTKEREVRKDLRTRPGMTRVREAEEKSIHVLYNVAALICCLLLIGVLLYTVSQLPEYGQENPRTVEVVSRYVEDGVEETGAVNTVAGIILDYRAFDTLGESHVLFTALVCVMILLLKDQKNMTHPGDNYFTIVDDSYFDISKDPIMHFVGMIVLPCILVFGIYILLNGQISPGGGFSGGTIMGAALIIFSATFGFGVTDRFFTRKFALTVTFLSLSFYSFAKGYVFFTGANGLDNHIPKGIPGAILSGGLILPLDIAVGFVVACTMFGIYSLFQRGNIGSD